MSQYPFQFLDELINKKKYRDIRNKFLYGRLNDPYVSSRFNRLSSMNAFGSSQEKGCVWYQEEYDPIAEDAHENMIDLPDYLQNTSQERLIWREVTLYFIEYLKERLDFEYSIYRKKVYSRLKYQDDLDKRVLYAKEQLSLLEEIGNNIEIIEFEEERKYLKDHLSKIILDIKSTIYYDQKSKIACPKKDSISEDALANFTDSLKTSGLIDESNTVREIKKLFDKIRTKKKILWKSTAEALYYFLKKLKSEGLIEVNGKKQWDVFGDYFVIVRNRSFDFSKLGKQHVPNSTKKKNDIDQCIKNLIES